VEAKEGEFHILIAGQLGQGPLGGCSERRGSDQAKTFCATISAPLAALRTTGIQQWERLGNSASQPCCGEVVSRKNKVSRTQGTKMTDARVMAYAVLQIRDY